MPAHPGNDQDLIAQLLSAAPSQADRAIILSMIDSGIPIKWGAISYYDQAAIYIGRNRTDKLGDFAHEYGHQMFRDHKISELEAAIVRRDEKTVHDLKMEREALAMSIEYLYGWSTYTGYLQHDVITTIYSQTVAQMSNLQNVTYEQFIRMFASNIKAGLRSNGFAYRTILEAARNDIKRGTLLNRFMSAGMDPILDPTVDGQSHIHISVGGQDIYDADLLIPDEFTVPAPVFLGDSTTQHVQVWVDGDKVVDEVREVSFDQFVAVVDDVAYAVLYTDFWGDGWTDGFGWTGWDDRDYDHESGYARSSESVVSVVGGSEGNTANPDISTERSTTQTMAAVLTQDISQFNVPATIWSGPPSYKQQFNTDIAV
jgi:hypothetical protein